MKAAQFHDKGDIRIVMVPEPKPRPGEVIVDIEWGGICGTDLHEYLIGPVAISTPARPHPITGEHLPVPLGHEFCGRISQISPEADDNGWKVGQAVMVDPRINCQKCRACVEGNDNCCAQWGFLGLNGGGGGGAGFAEKCAVKSRMCHLLPESVALADAALIEPLAVGRHALGVSGHADFSGLTALIVGGGPVGLSVLYNLRASGAGRVYVSEPTAARQMHTRELADEVFNPLIANVAEECRSRTDGLGVDVVFDCAGIPAGLVNGMDALKTRGTYVNVAGWEQPMVIPMQYFMLKEITIKSSMAYNDQSFRDTVQDFIAGKYKGAEKMITSRISLDDLAVKGFEELVTKKDHHVKILATPRSSLLAQ